MNVDVKILDPRLVDQMPTYATPGSAGLDLRACIDAPLTLAPNAWQLVPTGLAMWLKDPAYAALILMHWAGAEGGFGSLSDVASLFANPWLLLAGWLHYLAFDLFVGAWEVRTARAEGIPHWQVVPCLALTFLFGPAGFFVFSALRLSAARTKG